MDRPTADWRRSTAGRHWSPDCGRDRGDRAGGLRGPSSTEIDRGAVERAAERAPREFGWQAMTAGVLLIGFQDQDNLGLRYLLSAVRHAGFRGEIATYTADPAPICETVARVKPHVVGFSLIFQYMAPEFGRVIEALRAAGCRAHVTIGGHYPSFDYGEVLQRIPGADSVVRFEGEATLVELMERLASGREWRDILGIAYRRGTEIAANSLRPAIDDLDSLPEPDRADIDYRSRDLATASLLGSRGCPWNCSFCSIRPFYDAQGGRLRRLRAPRADAEEMRSVHFERGSIAFLF